MFQWINLSPKRKEMIHSRDLNKNSMNRYRGENIAFF